MSFQPDPARIRWRIHFDSAPDRVYRFLDSADGRERFWAEHAPEDEGSIEFRFTNGETLWSRILERDPPRRFTLSYFGGSVVDIQLAEDGNGGTDLTLTETGVRGEHRIENTAGWVSVLLNLKAAVDVGVDLRNHDPRRSWSQGYVDN